MLAARRVKAVLLADIYAMRIQNKSAPKKSTRSWTEVPFAENFLIFGLHSTPANTTHAFLKIAFLTLLIFVPEI